MAHDIFIEYYEINLATRNKRQTENTPLPPIENVEVMKAFKLLDKHKNKIIGKHFPYSHNQYTTALEHIEIKKDNNNKKIINFVIAYFDKTAPDRTLKDINKGTENVQKRKDYEAVKHLVHCVIRERKPFIAEIGIERVSGCPASRVNKTLASIFKELVKFAPNSEGVFQVTNPDGAKNSDGSDDIRSFILTPKIYPMCSKELSEAIKTGKLLKIKVSGNRVTKLDDPYQRLKPENKCDLIFKPTVKKNNESVQEYLSSLIETIMKNKNGINKPKTFAIIENQDTNSEQQIELATGNELQSAFVLRKKFDPTEGRKQQPDNTKINQIYLDEIWRKFP